MFVPPHKFVGGPIPQAPGVLVVRRELVRNPDLIQERERRLLHRALAPWRANPNLELLGNLEVPRGHGP